MLWIEPDGVFERRVPFREIVRAAGHAFDWVANDVRQADFRSTIHADQGLPNAGVGMNASQTRSAGASPGETAFEAMNLSTCRDRASTVFVVHHFPSGAVLSPRRPELSANIMAKLATSAAS